MLKRLLFACAAQVRHAADGSMHARAAQDFGVDHFAGHGFDHIRAGQEHEGLFLDHDDQVGQGGGVGRAARAGSEHDADLRDDARVLRVASENFGVAAQAAHAFLNARAARVDQADEGHAVADGQVHHAADLVACISLSVPP